MRVDQTVQMVAGWFQILHCDDKHSEKKEIKGVSIERTLNLNPFGHKPFYTNALYTFIYIYCIAKIFETLWFSWKMS